MDETLPVSSVRDRFSEVIDTVQLDGRRVALSRHGRPVAVLVPLADAEAIAEAEDSLDRTEAESALDAYKAHPEVTPAQVFFDAPLMSPAILLTPLAMMILRAQPPEDLTAYRRMIARLAMPERLQLRELAPEIWSWRDKGRRLMFAECDGQMVVLGLKMTTGETPLLELA